MKLFSCYVFDNIVLSSLCCGQWRSKGVVEADRFSGFFLRVGNLFYVGHNLYNNFFYVGPKGQQAQRPPHVAEALAAPLVVYAHCCLISMKSSLFNSYMQMLTVWYQYSQIKVSSKSSFI